MSQYPPPPQGPNYGQPPYGAPPPYGAGAPAPVPQSRTSGLAVASLIFALIGCVPVITSLLAVIFGFAGIGATRKPGVSGRGLAIAGLIIGFLGLIGWGIFGSTVGLLYLQTKPARVISKQFIADLSAGKVDAAAAACLPEMPRKSLEDSAATMKGWGTLTDTTLGSASMQKNVGSPTEVVVAGVAVFSGGMTKSVTIEMVKQGDTYKIRKFQIQ